MRDFIIVDSSALFALSDKKDSTHRLASKIIAALPNAALIIIPSEVFAETLNALWKKINRKQAARFGKKLLEQEAFLIEESTADLRRDALVKFENQPRSVSFTDCLVMAFADSYETKEIFGFDEAFHKNGYIRIGIDT